MPTSLSALQAHNTVPSYQPLGQPQASALWHRLRAGEHATGTLPHALAVKRHPYSHYEPVTADPLDYPANVRFAAVVKYAHAPMCIAEQD